MSEEQMTTTRAAFLRNGAKGTVVLATSGGILASMSGVAFAKGANKSDIATLQVGYIAESLAVKIYTAIVDNFHSFKGLQNKDYFVAALKNEKDHKAAWGHALGRHKPTGFHLHIPAAVVSSTHSLLKTGVALETAFVETYLGAVKSFSSTDLKVAAAAVAANEASHFSFFDAAFGGHGVTKSFPGTVTAAQAAALLKTDGFLS